MRARLNEIVDAAVGEKLKAALKERALLTEMMSATDVEEIRRQMEEAEARKLQPHYIRSFFLEAFRLLGGQISKREPGRYEITNVPADIRNRGKTLGAGVPIVPRYTRVTFEKALDVTARANRRRSSSRRATRCWTRPSTWCWSATGRCSSRARCSSQTPTRARSLRALVYVEHAIQNARELGDGQRQVVSKRLQFVELTQDWEPRIAGYAPYLDYRPIEPDELELVRELVEEEWLARGVEKAGIDYAITHAVPEHLAEVKQQTETRVDLTKEAVHRRLTQEIQYWDHRANELKQQELAGKQPRMNSGSRPPTRRRPSGPAQAAA